MKSTTLTRVGADVMIGSMYPHPDVVPYTPVPRVPGIAQQLTEKIADSEDQEWSDQVYSLLDGQTKEVLEGLLADSASFEKLHWASMYLSISEYMSANPDEYEDEDYPSSYESEEYDPSLLSSEEFFLRLAFKLLPVVVHIHKPMLSIQATLSWSGEWEENDENDLYQSVSNVIQSMMSDFKATEQSLKVACGYYLLGEYVQEERFPPQEQIEWLSEHVMDLVDYEEKVFRDGFDYDLARTIVEIDTPVLRNGAL